MNPNASIIVANAMIRASGCSIPTAITFANPTAVAVLSFRFIRLPLSKGRIPVPESNREPPAGRDRDRIRGGLTPRSPVNSEPPKPAGESNPGDRHSRLVIRSRERSSHYPRGEVNGSVMVGDPVWGPVHERGGPSDRHAPGVTLRSHGLPPPWRFGVVPHAVGSVLAPLRLSSQ